MSSTDSMKSHPQSPDGDIEKKLSHDPNTPPTDHAPLPFSKIHEIFFIFIICLSQFLALAGLAQSIAPLHIIGDNFGISNPGELSWYPAAFSLTVGTFILPAGRLGDIHGHKKLYIIGLGWYAVWSMVAGLSVYSGDILFSVARGFQGIGPAIMVPNALAIVGRTYPPCDKKNLIFALFGAAAPTGWVVGAAFSSIFAQLAWWPWAFWTLAIACVVAAVAAQFIIPTDELDHDGAVKFDFLGCITGVTGLILFNFAWNQAAVVGWATVYNYVLLIVGILFLVVFVWVEMKVADQPLVPLKALSKESILALAVIAAGWGSFGVWVYYLWNFIEVVRSYSALAACAQNAPVAVSGLLASVATGILLSKTKVSNVLLIATLCFLIGQILIATAPVHQTYWAQTFVSIIIMPWGMDMSFPSGTIILSNTTAKEHQGVAASLVNTVVNYSISIALGIAGTVDRNVNQGGENVLKGYRGAWYFGIGLDGVAVLIALYFVWRMRG